MESDTSSFTDRHTQTRLLRRVVARKITRKFAAHRERISVEEQIAANFLESPSLENVDEMCASHGYGRVRRALALIDNLIFEEFFYGKLFFYPLWIKRFTQLLEAARPRHTLKQLKSNQE